MTQTKLQSQAMGQGINAVSVYKSGGQAITTGTITTLTFDSEDFDGNNLHDNVTNNSRLTAVVTGYYIVTGILSYNPGFTATRTAVLLWKNGGTIGQVEYASTDTTRTDVAICQVVQLNAGEYVELEAFHNQGGSQTAGGTVSGCRFSMARIGL